MAVGFHLCIDDQAGEFVTLQAEVEQQAAPTVVGAMWRGNAPTVVGCRPRWSSKPHPRSGRQCGEVEGPEW